jgi:hypothetical protein
MGTIIYQALIGRHPFYSTGMNRGDLHDRVCNKDDFLQDTDFVALPRKWQLVIRKLLEKKRANRINTAAQAAKLLRKLKDE